ncbi:transmembrane channel-like protein 7 isoform X1 [Oratosquilla oratoria]|uniref:transmembrane channel-like protein 7 isoform X1 n=1 Tax=Oratosquilla oratoria TaxID=337810 RepID=UPI003F76D787
MFSDHSEDSILDHARIEDLEEDPRHAYLYERTGEDEVSIVQLTRAKTDVNLAERDQGPRLVRHNTYYGEDKRHMYYHGDLLSNTAHQYGSMHRSAWFRTVMDHRRRGIKPRNEAEAMDEITQAMVHDEELMADDVDGEVRRRDALRELTRSLRVKKEIKKELTLRRSSTRTSSKKISTWQHFKYIMSMKWFKAKQSVKSTFHDYSLWHKDLKEIEGIFGSGVGSYFRFLRYLFILNLIITIIIFGFLVVPQLLSRFYTLPNSDTNNITTTSSKTFGQSINGISLHVKDNAYVEETYDQSLLQVTPFAQEYTVAFGPLDWLTGAGWFNSTELYYGAYLSQSFSLVGETAYSIPEAYFFTILICFFIYLVVILRRVTQLYRQNYIDTEHDMSTSFMKKVFCAWDFNITSEKAAAIKHKGIYSELVELLQEFGHEEEEESKWKRLGSFIVKTFFWIIICGALVLVGWLIYELLEEGLKESLENQMNLPGDTYFESSLSLMVYPVIVTAIIIIIPIIFELVVKIEGYKNPRIKLYVTLIRTILLELLVLGVLIFFWYKQSPGLRKQIENVGESDSDHGNLSEPHNQTESTPLCWEVGLGQEIYRLLIVDFLVILISSYPLDFIKNLLVSRGKMEDSVQDFNIARNTLHLIYSQTLLWAGLFFCPLAPIIVALKMVITFYLQKVSIVRNLKPTRRPWRAAQTETVFSALTLLSLILAFMAYGFVLARGSSSTECGPFVDYKHYIDFMWKLFSSDETSILHVIGFFFKPGVVAALLGALAIMVYCAKSIAEGREEMVKVLRQQLELEVMDRGFLLQLTEKVRKGDYKPGNVMNTSQLSGNEESQPLDNTQRGSFVFSSKNDDPDDDIF